MYAASYPCMYVGKYVTVSNQHMAGFLKFGHIYATYTDHDSGTQLIIV